MNGARAKPGKKVHLGDRLKITRGPDERTLVVTGFSEKRGAASVAATLYEETPESIALRELRAAQHKAAGKQVITDRKPSKRQRRMIYRFRENNPG